MARVDMRNLKKHFDGVRAVDGVDLSIEDGELLVLLGPSGCGKTTLMRMVAGLEHPTEGEIYIGDMLADASVPPRERGVAMVFQSYALYPHKRAYDNIAFPLQSVRMAAERVREKVAEGARMFGIGHLLQRFPRELSGGERQRVALSRAVVRDPQVFLLDEPLSNLDAKLRATARDELKQFQRQVGTTTIYVTHDQVEAMGLGDRIAVMDQGRVRQVGTPREVYSNPADTFVATFVGSPPMNLVDLDEQTILGFRPESFLPVSAYDGSRALRTFGFRVRRIEYLGSDRLLYGHLEEGVPRAAREASIISKLPFTVPAVLQEGERYDFGVPEEELRYFDRATGVRRSP